MEILPNIWRIKSILRLFQKTEEERTLPNVSYEGSIILIPKPNKDKDTTRKEHHTSVFLTKIFFFFFYQYSTKYGQHNSGEHWKDYTSWPSEIYSWYAKMFQHAQVNKCNTYYINRMKEKKCDINWCRKSIWDNVMPFHDKNSQ